ncbi:MAG TPA: hypothetical protein C5S37_12115 [Methanophagales archaeon]|nr:hypothetical protein [Methanophagales archaeon]
MNEVEITWVMRELMRLLQNIHDSGFEEGEIEERLDEIKSELGTWFIDTLSFFFKERTCAKKEITMNGRMGGIGVNNDIQSIE